MKHLLTITSDDTLVDGLQEALRLDNVDFQEVPDWSTASDRLVSSTFEAVCIDYESIKIEGFDAFVQLDNILQKESTEAILLLREETERARQFVETLDSMAAAVNLADDSVERFRASLQEILDQRDDPDDAPERPRRSISMQVELPSTRQGSLAEVPVARLVHALACQEATGLLELSKASMDRRFAFLDGRLADPPDIKTSSPDNLKAAFAWSDGNYQFDARTDIDGETSDPYPILLKGAINHLDQRSAMSALTSRMDRYAVTTDRWEERSPALDRSDDLATFVEACDRASTLEQILSSVASRALKGFQAAFFAIACDLVALTDEPVNGRLVVDFAESASDSPTSPAPPAEEPTTAEREEALRERHNQIKDAGPYEVLDLWEGCGEDAVRSRYFELVKTNHPDAYGGNISPEGKRLAEEIFINIKKAYSKLLRNEDEQTTIPPSEQQTDRSDLGVDSSEGLSSRSVTAMGSGEAGDRDQGSEPSLDESSKPTALGGRDDPQATMPPGSGRDDQTTVSVQTDAGPDDDPDATIPPEHPSGPAGGEQSSPADNERRQKLEKLKQRASSSPVGAKNSSAGTDPANRKRKLDGLRKSSSSQLNEKVDKLEAAETSDEAQEYFNRGYKAYKNENHQKALQLFEKAHEFDEDNGLYKTLYGYLQFLTNPDNKDTAQQLLREALKSDNKQAQPDAHLFFGRILKVKDEHERAKRHFERAVELNPNSIEAKRELRVYQMREKKGASPTGEKQNAGDKLKNLFNKDLF